MGVPADSANYQDLLPPPVSLHPEVAAFLPWQQRLAVLAQQVLEGREPSLSQLVSLCLMPEVSIYRYQTPPAQPPGALPSSKSLKKRRVAYTRAVWEARVLLGGVWRTVASHIGGSVKKRLCLAHGTGEVSPA